MITHCLNSPPPCMTIDRALQVYIEPFTRVMEYVNLCNVAGDICEFGTYNGFTAHLLSQLMKPLHQRMYLYDSWEGFPEITSIDKYCKEVEDGLWKQGDCKVAEGVEGKIFDTINAVIPGRLSMVKGFYTEQTPVPEKIALLHIDCDLYTSTKMALKICAPKLTDGAVILFDDFNNNLASNQFGERRAFAETIANQCEPWFTYGWSGYAFIYHREQRGA